MTRFIALAQVGNPDKKKVKLLEVLYCNSLLGHSQLVTGKQKGAKQNTSKTKIQAKPSKVSKKKTCKINHQEVIKKREI